MALSETAAPPRRPPSVPRFDPTEFQLELVAVRRETAEIRSFDFVPLGLDRPLRFHPGQALTLQLKVDGGTAYRSFTIASSPTRPQQLTLTVKAAANGRMTRWMHQSLLPGMRVTARGPVGRFSLVWHHAPKLLLISAGSGATPMMSMLRWLADRREATDVAYVHVARTPEDLLFRTELEELQRGMPNLQIAFAVTAPPEGWTGHGGRLTRPLLKSMVPDAATRETFCCGPTGFMSATEQIYLAEGGDATRFHTETFGAATPDVATDVVAPGPDGGPLTLLFGDRAIPGDPDLTVLAAALAGGLVIPTGCRNGICGTCRLQLRRGEVDMQHNGGLSEREEREGFILACCSKPRSDLVLEKPGR